MPFKMETSSTSASMSNIVSSTLSPGCQAPEQSIQPRVDTGCTRPSKYNLSDTPAVKSTLVNAFPMRITTYYRSLIRSPQDPIAKQVIPHAAELDDVERTDDPLAETAQSPAPCLIHRYPQRVVFLVSRQCAVHCRFCMRKRHTALAEHLSRADLQKALDYIQSCRQINEVILSGGDPLMLDDEPLLRLLSTLHHIPHVHLLRIHTRMPCVHPQRITPSLARQLSLLQPLYINIHFNHPAEITPQAATACTLLADNGIALGSQTVLLKDVNDDPAVMQKLMMDLLHIRVRPYYLHQLDRVPGTAHFQVPLERGLDIMAALRGRLPGLAVPHFMIDLPGGGGKVPLLPESVVHKKKDHWVLRNWQGKRFNYSLD